MFTHWCIQFYYTVQKYTDEMYGDIDIDYESLTLLANHQIQFDCVRIHTQLNNKKVSLFFFGYASAERYWNWYTYYYHYYIVTTILTNAIVDMNEDGYTTLWFCIFTNNTIISTQYTFAQKVLFFSSSDYYKALHIMLCSCFVYYTYFVSSYSSS